MIPARDPGALADRLAQLARDPQARLRMGRRAREVYLEQFTVQRFEERLQDVLTRSLDER